jgi:hypothetical protein
MKSETNCNNTRCKTRLQSLVRILNLQTEQNKELRTIYWSKVLKLLYADHKLIIAESKNHLQKSVFLMKLNSMKMLQENINSKNYKNYKNDVLWVMVIKCQKRIFQSEF